MRGTDFPDTAPTPAKTNGVHRGAKKNGAASRQPVPDPPAAVFAPAEPLPVDAPMWPVYPARWFQPVLSPTAPVWSDLGIERHNRIPAPDFLHSETAPLNLASAREDRCEAVAPRVHPQVPDNDLELLGWDPRTMTGQAPCRRNGEREKEAQA